jgi:phosphate transport system substrate-binding protein
VNVSVALQGARINNDGTQVLGGVYRNSDSRAYPISSYSYMIVPTTEASPFNASKGQSLSEYIFYFLCAGQQKAEQLGYAPLPRNLVEFGFEAVARIPGAVAAPAIDSCANPTITGGFLVPKATTAPATAPATTPSANPTATAAPSGASGGNSDNGGASTTGTTIPGATTVPGAVGEPVTQDDETTDGEVSDATGGEAVIATPGIAMATSVEIDTEGSGTSPVIYLLIAVLILGIAVGPPIVAGRLRPSVKQ